MSDSRSTTDGGAATGEAKQQAQQIKGTAEDTAGNVGDSAAARGRELRSDARQHARSIAQDAQRNLRGHAEEEIERAGAALGTAGEQLQALAHGRVDEAGVLGDRLGTAADAVNRWADTIQDRGLDGLLDDLRSYGRRRPGMFLSGALAAGIVAGRFGRNAAQPSTGDVGDGASTTTTGDDATASDAEGAGQITDDNHSDGDVIVGYASSDDSSVLAAPHDTATGPGADDRTGPLVHDADDVQYRPVDVDQERGR